MARMIVAGVLCVLTAMPASAQVSDQAAWRDFAARLETNAFVRVRLANGQSFRGHVIGADDQFIRVNPQTRIAVPMRQLAYGDIMSIERQKEPKWTPAAKVLLGVAITLGVLYGIAIAAVASGD